MFLSVILGHWLAMDGFIMFKVTLVFQSRWQDVSDNHSSMLSDGAKQLRSYQYAMIMCFPSSDIR